MVHVTRRQFTKLLGGVAALWPIAARAQQPEGMRRIAVLMDTDDSNSDGQTRVAALRQTLQQLGWTEGRNMRRFALGRR
jgi:putative ABC transport system substrate-binding protein